MFIELQSLHGTSVLNLKHHPFILQQRMAQEVLTHLKEHPDAWTRVDTILEFSQNMNTKVSISPDSNDGKTFTGALRKKYLKNTVHKRKTEWKQIGLECSRIIYGMLFK